MELEICKITGGPFHFGRHGLGLEEQCIHLTSDTLVSALIAGQVEMDDASATQAWAARFQPPAPNLALTSAFPFAGEVLFFPTPRRTAQPKSGNRVRAKDLKRTAYLSEQLFRQVLQGASLLDIYNNAERLQDGELLLTKEERGNLPKPLTVDKAVLWKTELRPRVTVDRDRSSSNLFHIGCTTYTPGCGLWFGVYWLQPSPALIMQFERLLHHLAESGLGGDRSAGFGASSISAHGSCCLPQSRGTTWVNLSHYLPADDEMGALEHPSAAYSVQKVGGWASSPTQISQRRITLHMLAEGSVLGPLEKDTPGQMVDVQPSYGGSKPLGHPAWRSGVSVAAGILLDSGGGI
jgi:CRISPR-associated protein Csm4